MRDPIPELDERFSDPDAEPTPWVETERVLEGAQLSWVTTVRADGRPHVTPLVAVWVDGAIHFATAAREQKAKNLEGNPHVVVSTGCNTWDRGLDVIVEGEAKRTTDRSTLERLASAWASTWDGRWSYGVGDGTLVHPDDGTPVLVFSVEPAKVLAFAKGGFAHTRYRSQ